MDVDKRHAVMVQRFSCQNLAYKWKDYTSIDLEYKVYFFFFFWSLGQGLFQWGGNAMGIGSWAIDYLLDKSKPNKKTKEKLTRKKHGFDRKK